MVQQLRSQLQCISLMLVVLMSCTSASIQTTCNTSTPRTQNMEWSGPSLAHGFVGDGSEEACATWCCAEEGCETWSLLFDVACHLEQGQRCCMGWPANRTLSVSHAASAQCVSARVDGKPMPTPWPQHPTWTPTWDMAMSTVMMPCNTSGWFDPALAAQYGIADFDWSNARDMWANQAPMDDGKRLITQAAKVKAVNENTHVWIYRNLVKALSWYSDVGEKLSDPAYSGWFLHFKNGIHGNYTSPPCTAGTCSDLYHSQDQTPQHSTGRKECIGECDCGGVPCGEYIWDHRNASLREWLVKEHVLGTSSNGMDGLANPNVTGFYFDDYWAKSGEGWSHGPDGLPPPTAINLSDCKTGPSEIEIHCLLDMGLSVQDVLDLNAGWRETTANAMRAVAKGGGWVWQMFSSLGFEDTGAECLDSLRAQCAEQNMAMSYMPLRLKDNLPGSVVDAASDVAKFLLVRGPFAFLGTGWVGCEPDNGVEGGGRNQTYARPSEFDIDYGTPLGLCSETKANSGVFSRMYTKATTTHDCATGKSTVVMI
eukprot:m.65878 g.65878  ORF g.65878 m.65878 type:complete len:539 (+) comp23614_c0_seq1:190-1806(+)